MSAFVYLAVVILSGLALVVFGARLVLAGRRSPHFNRRLAQAWAAFALFVALSLPVLQGLGAPLPALIAATAVAAALGGLVLRLTVAKPGPAAFAVIGGITGLVGIAGLLGHAWWGEEFQVPVGRGCAELEHLEIRSAAADAARDAERGAVHLIGVHGYSVELPGVPRDRGGWLPANYRVQVLPCTSDAVVSRRHGALNKKARAYAAAYNRAVLARPGAPPLLYLADPGE